MRFVRFFLRLCSVLMAGYAWAQEPATGIPELQPVAALAAGQLSFSFVPKVPGQVAWTITVAPDGKGVYAELVSGAARQPLHVSDAVWKRLQTGTKAVESGHCETKTKGIAQTGEKTFSVATGPAPTSCKFNYSDDEALNDAASAFIALAETLHEGAKLQRDHRFDKLALDADMEALVSEVEAGRALEPGNIAPILQSLVDDEHVIDRVRRKAARLLQATDASTVPDKPR